MKLFNKFKKYISNINDNPFKSRSKSSVIFNHYGKRNYYSTFGYSKKIMPKDYLDMYLRQEIANRVVNTFPEAIWSKPPVITDKPESHEETEFTKKLELIEKEFKLFNTICRLDILTGLGHFGLLLLGINDGLPLSKPIKRKSFNENDLLFITPFGEYSIMIQKYETDPTNKRYGLPLLYQITMNNRMEQETTTNMSPTVFVVHYSRVLHVAEGLLSNNVSGIPRLECVMNRLEDYEKVIGGTAEVFYLNSRGGIHFNLDKDSRASEEELEEMKDSIECSLNGLSRAYITRGVDVNVVQFNINESKEILSDIITSIAIGSDIPQRKLTGAETAKLAGDQDDTGFLTTVDERRKNHCENSILRPLIDKFIELGILPFVEKYEIIWPDLRTETSKEKADNAMKMAQATTIFKSGNADHLLTDKQFVEDIAGQEYKESEVNKNINEEDEQIDEDNEIIKKEDKKDKENK